MDRPSRSLDRAVWRKASTYKDIPDLDIKTFLENEEFFDYLNVYDERDLRPEPRWFIEDFTNPELPQHFIMKAYDGSTYYVNTEGYDYPRYAIRIPVLEKNLPEWAQLFSFRKHRGTSFIRYQDEIRVWDPSNVATRKEWIKEKIIALLGHNIDWEQLSTASVEVKRRALVIESIRYGKLEGIWRMGIRTLQGMEGVEDKVDWAVINFIRG